MHRMTRMIITLGLAVALPTLAHALVIGPGIDTKSSLGQPFHGQIKLGSLGDIEADDLRVTLGTDADFRQMGLDGTVYYAPDLSFKVVVHHDGESYIDVSTTKPVNEPAMDFVMRVSWPNNDRLSDVTVVLDPPASKK